MLRLIRDLVGCRDDKEEGPFWRTPFKLFMLDMPLVRKQTMLQALCLTAEAAWTSCYTMSYSIFHANKSTWIPDSNLNAAGSEKQFPNFCNKGKLFPFLQAPLPQCFWGRLLFNQYEKSIIRGNSCKINKRIRNQHVFSDQAMPSK